MNGKAHTEKTLSIMIDAARRYIEAKDLRDSIISKCHQEIGLVFMGASTQKRAAIGLTPQETTAISSALSSWRAENEGAWD